MVQKESIDQNQELAEKLQKTEKALQLKNDAVDWKVNKLDDEVAKHVENLKDGVSARVRIADGFSPTPQP